MRRSSSIRRPIFWTRSWGRWSARQPPDFTFQLWLLDYFQQWARDDRLVDLSDSVGSFSDLFDSNALDWATRFNAGTGPKALFSSG
jgi:hypothetical protein